MQAIYHCQSDGRIFLDQSCSLLEQPLQKTQECGQKNYQPKKITKENKIDELLVPSDIIYSAATNSKERKKDVVSSESVTVIERKQLLPKTPPLKKRKTFNKAKAISQSDCLATKHNPIDMTEFSPFISSKSMIDLTIKLTNEEEKQRLAVTDITNRSDIIKRFEVPGQFSECSMEVLNSLTLLETEPARRGSPECVKMILFLRTDKSDSLGTIEGSLDGQDIHELLQAQYFLSDAPLEYYRCLLICEEMKRALMLNQVQWRKS